MKRVLVSLTLLAVAVPLLAQSVTKDSGIRVHIGYGTTPSFGKNFGGTARVSGPEIGIALPIGTFLRQDLLVEPSYFAGGRLRHGGDDDADAYRLTLFLHHTLRRGIGLRAGVGYANCTNSRGIGQFQGTSGVIGDFGGEIPFSQRLLKGFSPYVDVHAVVGDPKLSGFFVGLGSKV